MFVALIRKRVNDDCQDEALAVSHLNKREKINAIVVDPDKLLHVNTYKKMRPILFNVPVQTALLVGSRELLSRRFFTGA